MDLLQEIRKEVSLKQTGIKQEPYLGSGKGSNTNHLQQNISQLQTDIQSPKDAINTPPTQYAAPLDNSPTTLQQQLSTMKADIKHLQQMKRSNVYTPLGNYRSFRTTDGLVICRQVICRQCNQVGHFARACPGNLPPPTASKHYQNHRYNCFPPSPFPTPFL